MGGCEQNWGSGEEDSPGLASCALSGLLSPPSGRCLVPLSADGVQSHYINPGLSSVPRTPCVPASTSHIPCPKPSFLLCP